MQLNSYLFIAKGREIVDKTTNIKSIVIAPMTFEKFVAVTVGDHNSVLAHVSQRYPSQMDPGGYDVRKAGSQEVAAPVDTQIICYQLHLPTSGGKKRTEFSESSELNAPNGESF